MSSFCRCRPNHLHPRFTLSFEPERRVVQARTAINAWRDLGPSCPHLVISRKSISVLDSTKRNRSAAHDCGEVERLPNLAGGSPNTVLVAAAAASLSCHKISIRHSARCLCRRRGIFELPEDLHLPQCDMLVPGRKMWPLVHSHNFMLNLPVDFLPRQTTHACTTIHAPYLGA